MIDRKSKAAAGRIVVISGMACSGKSIIGRALAARLNVPFLSMGNFSREYAERQFGMDIHEFQDFCRDNPHLDKEIDAAFCAQCRQTAEEKGLIVDFRLGGHFFPDAYKIYLEVSDEEAEARIKERGDEALEVLKRRNDGLRDRLKAAYGFDFTDIKNYNYTRCVDWDSVYWSTEGIYSALPDPWPTSYNNRRKMVYCEGIWGVDFGNGTGKPWTS